MSVVLRALLAAFLLLPLAAAPASAMEKHKLALQISDATPEKMNAVLNVAANVSKYYSDKGDEVEIQIVAFNDGAARLLRLPEQDLRWRRLADLNSALSTPSTLARLFATLATGRHDRFELTLTSDREDIHLNVGVAAVGDLISATLTDIGDLKRSEIGRAHV